MISLALVTLLAVATVNAERPAYSQCGGDSWTGETSCASGFTCSASSSWYSQCVPAVGVRSEDVGVFAGTIYLAGDSTTATDAGTAYAGWGTQIGKYLTGSVQNKAVAGKSSRSFTDLGYFKQIINSAKTGDVVIIEFGHNEGGGPAGNPQQGVCAGTSLTATCSDNGKTVYTYFKYMEDAVNSIKAKGAGVVVSSQTPNNPFKDNGGVPIYVDYAKQVAAETNVSYVDHFNYLLTSYKQLGASVVNGYFPQDNIHTSSAGADVAAQALVRGILCDPTNPLFSSVSKTNVKPADCITA